MWVQKVMEALHFNVVGAKSYNMHKAFLRCGHSKGDARKTGYLANSRAINIMHSSSSSNISSKNDNSNYTAASSHKAEECGRSGEGN